MIKLIKNKMVHYIVAMFTLLLLCVSCSSLGLDSFSNELSESETSELIERARLYITKAKKLNITPADKRFVQNKLPRVFIDYTGYKSGSAKMVWRINPSYSIRIIFTGDLTDKKGEIRLTVSRFK